MRGLRLVVLLLSTVASAGGLERLTVQRTTSDGRVRDCYVWLEVPDANGNSTTLYVGRYGTSEKRTLMRFDVSAIPPDATVVEARLIIHVEAAGTAIEVHPLTADWVETAPTWNNANATISPSVKATFTPVMGKNEIDLTGVVQGWVSSGQNFGFALTEQTLTRTTTIASSEVADPLRRPSLEVLFTRATPLVERPVPPLFAVCGVPFRYPLGAHAPQATGFSLEGEGPALDEATGELTWTPEPADRGAHAFTVEVSRGPREEALPLELEVSCGRTMQVGCSAASGAPALLLLGLLLRRR